MRLSPEDQSAMVGATGAAGRPPAAAPMPITARGARLLASLPLPVRFALLVTASFAAVVIAISAVIGVPFTPPTERVGMATGINSGLPLALGILGYLLAEGVRRLFGRGAVDRNLGRTLATDFTLLALFMAAFYFHFNLKMWIPLINGTLFDPVYFATDNAVRWLIDGIIAVRLGLARDNVMVDHWYQLLFFASFAISFIYHGVVNRRFFYPYVLAIIVMLCVGGLSYLVAPAVGPFIYEPGVNLIATQAQANMWAAFQQVQLNGAAWIGEHGPSYFTGPLAAMPSLHIGNGLISTYYMVRGRTPLAWVFGALFGWVFIESIAARWHYLIDAPFGLLLAIAVIYLANRVCAASAPAKAAAKL